MFALRGFDFHNRCVARTLYVFDSGFAVRFVFVTLTRVGNNFSVADLEAPTPFTFRIFRVKFPFAEKFECGPADFIKKPAV